MSTLKKPVPFGKYYLLERINVGGMAEVFKAKTFGVEGFERLLAVKRILPNIAEDEEFITMFIDEAKIAVQLQHANIAQIFDLGKVDDSYFIALEYVNGRDLRSIFDRMRSRGEALPIALACHVMMQVCEGLDYAHNKRDGQGRELHLIHRDISPQNVLIGYDGEVKLIDFGIAKAAGKASTTQAGILKGKFGYMSPEQVRGLPIDKRSDIFAVGIVLYELLTGERLFVGETDFSTLEKVRNVEIVPPSSYNKKIPQELERLMMKALARDPEDRYSNAIDLHDDLQSFLYSIGEFYSRKDLAGWMKKTFAAEIEEDNAKIEQYRQIAAPVGASNEVSRRAAVVGAGSRVGAPAVPLSKDATKDMKQDKNVPSAMGWDDEELDTQIFDKTDENAADKTVEQSAADLFFEDDDRTVANEPPPDILEQARPPEVLATPKPQRSRPRRSGRCPRRSTSRHRRSRLPSRPVPRRPTLTGVPPTPLRSPTRPLATLPPPPPVPRRRGRRRRSCAVRGSTCRPLRSRRRRRRRRPCRTRSSLRDVRASGRRAAASASASAHAGADSAAAAELPTSPSGTAPFGAGNFSDELSRGRSKGGERISQGGDRAPAGRGRQRSLLVHDHHQAGADRDHHRPGRCDGPGRQHQGRGPLARLARSVARPVHRVGHPGRLRPQRSERRGARRPAAAAHGHARALARHRLRADQRTAGRVGLARRRADPGRGRPAGAHRLSSLPDRARASPPGDQRGESVQALAAGRPGRAGRHSEGPRHVDPGRRRSATPGSGKTPSHPEAAVAPPPPPPRRTLRRRAPAQPARGDA